MGLLVSLIYAKVSQFLSIVFCCFFLICVECLVLVIKLLNRCMIFFLNFVSVCGSKSFCECI